MDAEARGPINRRSRRVQLSISLTGWAVSVGLFLVHLYGAWAGAQYAGFETASGPTLLACFGLLVMLGDRILRLHHDDAFARLARVRKSRAGQRAARLRPWVSASLAFGVMAIMLATLGLPGPVVAAGWLVAGAFATALFLLESRRAGRARAPG